MAPRWLLAVILALPLISGCQEAGSNYWLSLPYHNDFSGTCDLPSSDDDAWKTDCEAGRYRIDNKHTRLGIASVGLKQATPAITVQADTGLTRGVQFTTPQDITNYGVACLTGSTNGQPTGYLFVVSDDGVWAILRKTTNGWSSLADNLNGDRFTPSRHAQVRGTCIASHGSALLSLAVDGQVVQTVSDDHPYTSFRGFGVVAVTTRPNTETWFDDLQARLPTVQERALRETAPPQTGSPVPHASGTLLSDRFTSNLHVWQVERNDAAHAAIRDGSYDLRVLSASIGQTDTRLLHDAAAVVVDADLRELRPGRASGVACLSAGGDGFLAEVSGATGRYAIWAQQGTEGTRIGAGHSAAVRSTGVNHLSLHCGASGGEVSLSVNGHVVADVRGGQTVDAYTQAQLVVESGRHTADTQFDNVVVRAVP